MRKIKNSDSIKLYNVLFPIWFFLFMADVIDY